MPALNVAVETPICIATSSSFECSASSSRLGLISSEWRFPCTCASLSADYSSSIATMPGFPLLRPPFQNPPTHPAPPPPTQPRFPHHHPPPPRPLPAFHTNSSMIPSQTSVQPINPKLVTDPLPGTARARIQASSATNYSSSGSDHDPTSICLAEMVHEFLEEEGHVGSCGRARCNCLNGTCSGEASPPSEADEPSLPREPLSEILEELVSSASSDELKLLADVTKALEVEKGVHSDVAVKQYGTNAVRGCLRRPVMKHLRQVGYNAAICKTRWNHAEGIPAGDYEFIDVLMDGKNAKFDRYIVDIDFKAQFEIARASNQYCELLDVLPGTFVGRADTLKKILKVMSSATKHSLKKQNLLLPPWRKQRYMQAKWFSPYRRTTNEESQKSRKSEPLGLLTLRAPPFCLEFAKEMDAFHFRSQTKVCKGDLNLGTREEYIEAADSRAATRAAAVSGKNPKKSWIDPREICTVMSTDWQLPPLDERRVDRSRGRISGLANALKEAGVCSPAPLPKSIDESETFLTKQQMLIAVS